MAQMRALLLISVFIASFSFGEGLQLALIFTRYHRSREWLISVSRRHYNLHSQSKGLFRK